jgi:hypothetical protein
MKRLPIKVGTVVIYTRQAVEWLDGMVRPQGKPRLARVVGYDMFRSKYHLGLEYAPGLFADSGTWAFDKEVEVKA